MGYEKGFWQYKSEFGIELNWKRQDLVNIKDHDNGCYKGKVDI